MRCLQKRCTSVLTSVAITKYMTEPESPEDRDVWCHECGEEMPENDVMNNSGQCPSCGTQVQFTEELEELAKPSLDAFTSD